MTRNLSEPLTKQPPCHAVDSLEELQWIICTANQLNARTLAKSVFVKCWVNAANLFLDIIRQVLFKSQPPPLGIKNIVVYTVGILGDNVVRLPALAALRCHYPHARITVINHCQTWSARIAEGILGPCGLKDHLITLNEDPVRRVRHRFIMDRDKFADVNCDLFVNLSPFGNRGWFGAVVREIIFARMLGAHYAVGFRMSTLSRGRYFNAVQYRFVQNEPRRYRNVLVQLGLPPIEAKDFLYHDDDARMAILEKLKTKGVDPARVFVVNPGAKFIAQRWPAERFGEIAEYLTTTHAMTVVVTGTSSEHSIAEEVVRFSGGVAVNLAGETNVAELIELLRIANGCVTNDTGTMHLAAMVGVPTVAIFSHRHTPTLWLPMGERVVSLFSIPECRYCYNDQCQKGECLKAIGTDTVLQQIQKLLGHQAANTHKG